MTQGIRTGSLVTFRTSVKPLLRSPCCAQARGGLPWPPVERMRSTLGGCEEDVLSSTLRHMTRESVPFMAVNVVERRSAKHSLTDPR